MDKKTETSVARVWFPDYWRALRPLHWARSALVLVPLISSGSFLEPGAVARALLAFAAFALLSSAVYLLNDIADRREDRIHPRKRLRPVAAGRIGVASAAWLATLLAGAAFVIAFALRSAAVLAIFGTYAAANVGYSWGGKRIVLLDVFLVTAGFVLRVMAGAYAIAVYVSPWLFVVTLFLSLAISLVKRRAEEVSLAGEAAQHRAVLGQYSVLLLDQLIAVTTAAGMLSYALYTFHSPHSDYLMLTLPFFIYASFRYLYVAYQKGMGESPEEIFLRDRPFQVNLALYVACVLAILVRFG